MSRPPITGIGAVAVSAARGRQGHLWRKAPGPQLGRRTRRSVDAVRRYGRVWQTGSWQRSLSEFRFACELVRNGRIGRLTKVEVGLPAGLTDWDGLGGEVESRSPPKTLDWQRWFGPAPYVPYAPARVHKTWRWNFDTGGGSLMDWVGHHVDIAHWGMGRTTRPVLEIRPSGLVFPPAPDYGSGVSIEPQTLPVRFRKRGLKALRSG